MEDKELVDLIDDFLLGRIQNEDLARLEYLRKTFPEIDLKVQQSQHAYQVLLYAYHKELRRKLKQIDAADAIKSGQSMFRKWIPVSIIILLSILGVWIWAIAYFSPSTLALRYFSDVSEISFWDAHPSETTISNWEQASRAFRSGDYEKAIALFQPFLDHPDTIMAGVAKWNILLARLGLEGPEITWKDELSSIASGAREPIRKKAGRLLQIVDSPFYQVVLWGLSPQLSALKPRLM